jgi:hypothetical protein
MFQVKATRSRQKPSGSNRSAAALIVAALESSAEFLQPVAGRHCANCHTETPAHWPDY